LLTIPSIIAGAAVLVALAAWIRARAAVERLARLTDSYWELRYETGQLKARVTRLEAAAGLADAASPPPPMPPVAASTTTFVPLHTLKK
jgi:hypothetical protein